MDDATVHDDAMAPPTLADVVKRIRGTTKQVTFAESVGISAAMIGHVEAGTRSLSVENVEKIIRALNLDGDTALALRRARDRKSGSPTPSLPTQIASVERILGGQLDRIEEAVTHLLETPPPTEVDYERLSQMIVDSHSRSDERIAGLTNQVDRVVALVETLFDALDSYAAGESTLPEQGTAPPPLPLRRARRSVPPAP